MGKRGGTGWSSLPGSAAAPLRAQGDNQSCSPTLQVRNSGQGLLQPPECCSSSEAQPELGLLSRVDVRTLLSQRFVGQLNIAHTPSRLLGHDAHGVLFQVPCSPHNLSFVGRSCLWPPFHSCRTPSPFLPWGHQTRYSFCLGPSFHPYTLLVSVQMPLPKDKGVTGVSLAPPATRRFPLLSSMAPPFCFLIVIFPDGPTFCDR